ncbi:MAG: SDR family NAD(P)-dependent oxidoreductase [Frankiaceae bacterium]|nr:SDR family NAD(P)-dependent oxidoreductase [Frankiaceae bacterium]MBV9872891.1 SDR family NAD(P)-dependent oxidoreductase [Frankiaceae bacterium]
MEQLRDRVAVVTGAGSGIGLAITEAFCDEGMRVVMADINEDAVAAAAAALVRQGADVHPVVADVRDPAAVDALGQAVAARYGSLHVAVNNAGVVAVGRSWEMPLEDWHRVIDVDLWGVIHGIRSFVPLILESGDEGHVVNTASMAAVVAIANLGPYNVAKHGVLALSDVLRAELVQLGAPVGVSVVMPGMIKTGMVPIASMPPSRVAVNVVDAIRRNRAYVFTDDESAAEVQQRLESIIAARGDVIATYGRGHDSAD